MNMIDVRRDQVTIDKIDMEALSAWPDDSSCMLRPKTSMGRAIIAISRNLPRQDTEYVPFLRTVSGQYMARHTDGEYHIIPECRPSTVETMFEECPHTDWSVPIFMGIIGILLVIIALIIIGISTQITLHMTVRQALKRSSRELDEIVSIVQDNSNELRNKHEQMWELSAQTLMLQVLQEKNAKGLGLTRNYELEAQLRRAQRILNKAGEHCQAFEGLPLLPSMPIRIPPRPALQSPISQLRSHPDNRVDGKTKGEYNVIKASEQEQLALLTNTVATTPRLEDTKRKLATSTEQTESRTGV